MVRLQRCALPEAPATTIINHHMSRPYMHTDPLAPSHPLTIT